MPFLRLTEGVPVVINQGRTPPLPFYVVDIEVCLPRTHFLRPKHQFIWLAVTSGQPSDPFGLRTLNFPMPLLKYPIGNRGTPIALGTKLNSSASS